MRGVEGRYWNENVFARPYVLREKVETAISCIGRGPGPTRKKKEIYIYHTSSREEEDVVAHIYVPV